MADSGHPAVKVRYAALTCLSSASTGRHWPAKVGLCLCIGSVRFVEPCQVVHEHYGPFGAYQRPSMRNGGIERNRVQQGLRLLVERKRVRKAALPLQGLDPGGDFGDTASLCPRAHVSDCAAVVTSSDSARCHAAGRGFNETLCADIDGFSLHAAVRCGADDRKALEQLCRYITRPACRQRRASGLAAALANQQAQCNAAGLVVLKLKTPWLRWSHARAGLHGIVREIPHANGCCEVIISAQ